MTTEIQQSVSPTLSPRPMSSFSSTSMPKMLTKSEVGKIVPGNFKEGEIVKGNCGDNVGNSRINYMPYEKKIVEYQDQKVIKRVPVKKKVVEYQ